MLQWILFFLLSINLFALEISFESAKDDFEKYSTLHIFNEEPFYCQEIKNDFDVTIEVVCAFNKRPARNLQKLQNDFFTLSSLSKKETFFISIKPVYKMVLICERFDLSKESTTYSATPGISNRWSLIGFKEKLPLVFQDDKVQEGINFPFYLDKDMLPFVDSLDIKGNPVHIKRVGDVKEYINIKRYFEEKKYEKALEVIADILEEYPDTLFKAELLYYKIKVHAVLEEYEALIEDSKYYLKEYSSNENVAEVLALAANAYAKSGLLSDAEYFFDRLFSEHQGSVASHWGFIYMGDLQESSGASSKAKEYFTKALMQTTDLDVAATAAFRLALMTQGSDSAESAGYIEKIANAKPGFFMENLESAQKVMQNFADEEEYKTAATIAEAIFSKMDPTYDEYEVYLANIGLWLAQTDDKQAALKALNRYIDAFPDGDFIKEVEFTKDGLFFDTLDLNASAKLAEYEKLIETYSNDTIGNRAVYERGKLLFELGEFEKIIQTKDALLQLDAEVYKDKEEIVTNAAIGIMKHSLQNKECKDVIAISNEYNITLSAEWDDGLFSCAMQGGDFQLAKNIAQKNINAQDETMRKEWLYRYLKVDFSIGNYSETIEAAKDLIVLIDSDKASQYNDVYRYLFDAYSRTEQKEKLLDVINTIEKLYGLSYEDIERYVAMLSLGNEQKDDVLIVKYATKVMQIQEKSSSYTQSPYVEFALYQAYLNAQKLNEALEVIESLNKRELTKEQRARQKYLLGSLLIKLWRDEEAKTALQESIDADPSSAWAELAKSALKL